MEALRVNNSILIPGSELSVSAARSGGPGGQNVNKVNTKVVVRWHMTGSRALSEPQRDRLFHRLSNKLTINGEIVISCEETRSQERNLAICLDKLRAMIIEALHIPKRRRATKPSAGARERRIQSKAKRGQTKKMRGRPASHD